MTMIVAGLVAAACLVLILWVDLPLICWLRDHAPRKAAKIFSGFGDGHFYLVVSLICAGVWWWKRNPARMRASLLFTATWAVDGATNLLLKGLFGRCRPVQYFNVNEYGFNWFETKKCYTSFPSGHSADVFAAATLLWTMFPRWRPAWAAWALLMAVSRVVSQNHYLSDTIAGAGLGVAVAAYVRGAFIRRKWYAPAAGGTRDPRPSSA